MRLLYASERPPYPFFLGGAARCAHRLLLALQRDFGVECRAVGSADYLQTPWSMPKREDWPALGVRGTDRDGGTFSLDCGYPVHVFPEFQDELARQAERFRPDVIWTQLDGALAVLQLAHRKDVRSVLYVHDAESDPAELRLASRLGARLVCSSRFIAGKVARLAGVTAAVVYPAPELPVDTIGDPHGFITMINPHRVKGLDTFLEIAARLPAQRFLLVESWQLAPEARRALEQKLQALANVSFMPRVSDMRPVYGATEILLVPSVWEEGFGMVALEAQACRIPVIASRRGGLPESVGDGGLLIADYRDPRAWLEAIATVRRNYDEFSRRALAHARSETFTDSHAARRFFELCAAKRRRFLSFN